MGLSFAESPINWLTTIHYPWSRCLLVLIPKRMQVSVHDLIYIIVRCLWDKVNFQDAYKQ